MKGENERLLYEILNEAYPGKWKSDCMFLDGRKHKGDAINESEKILIEIEGGLWIKGRHNQPIGYMTDMEKYNLATLQGWRILRYTPETLRKQPWKLIADVRKLCGASDGSQQTLCLDGCKQGTLSKVQVKISDPGMQRFSHGH